MLSAVIILALAASGAQAQNPACVAESNNVTYQYCGRVAVFNVYWTNQPQNQATAIIFEVPDNGYHSFGFSSQQQGGTAMLGANVIFGCDDFVVPGVPAAPRDTLIGPGPERSVASVAGGFGMGNTATLGTVTQTRENGICAIRFERLWEVPALPAAQNIVSGVSNGVVFARGAGDVPALHTARAFALQDFLTGVGGITANPVQPILDDGAASTATISRVLAVVVAAVTAALW